MSTLDQNPLWYKDAVIYELHVRAFFDSTNDGIGDFAGLTSKLDYLQDLGVTCLWLLPFYPSPLKDDGYDIANYEGIHPSYGSMRDFRHFLREAHARGLRVVTELVINHTSDQHPWFQAARRAPIGSSKRDYYVWSDTDRKYEGVRVIFTDTERSNWSWDAEAKQYYWHRFFHHQPDLNFDNPRVRRAVMKVMKFWLDMGVDGLRLDAIPYLIEREGTSCENLPETHAVLKDIRRELDAHYAGRMLLAEANQWPADVSHYLGQGDECHMAFHFPLMPRIFMALQQEDRYPIVEILRQTPEIPDICQWAIFLRNHDELTLEMVTDEERDYMYQAYAADPQMRLNLGIRRRLAPLMENNRQRIELLYGLLFTLPGTPVIYYGDELGMGDNIYLGDRNGVRTPMQWTGDRNAGFSRADPARLFAPPVMDPVYGYQGLNVEAQQRSPFSLLNFVKRSISLRKQHQVFGRGRIEFVPCSNRRVLVYLREFDGESMLIVANLSRAVQPAEIDLGRFAGLVPVELRDRTEFPRLGERPFFLSMAPYGFYVFQLQREPEPVALATGGMAPTLEEIHRPVFASGVWETLFEGNVRRLIERDHLLVYLQRQRWYPGKARQATSIQVIDWGLLARGTEPSFLLLIEVRYADEETDRFFVPVGTRAGEGALQLERETPGHVIARISGARKGVVHDRLNEGIGTELLHAIESGREIAMEHGTVLATRTSAFEPILGRQSSVELPVRRLSAEQSNTSLVYGDRMILKLIRRAQDGLNPDYEVNLHLSDRAGFARVPPVAGALEYRRRDGGIVILGVLNGLVEHQANAWDQALDLTRRFYDRTLAQPPMTDDLRGEAPLLALADRTIPKRILDTVGGLVESAAMLGRRTAEMHLALEQALGDPAFEPEALASADRHALAASMRATATHALETLERQLARIPEPLQDPARQLLSARDHVLARLGELEATEIHGTKVRVHGDYHLGQVLTNKGDFIILDFEGEPLRPMEERRAKQSPMKDVAGMIRSFDYASYAALFAYTALQPGDFGRLEPWARAGSRWVSALFLRNYLATAGDASFLPQDRRQRDVLLQVFLLEKALYELDYELGNRPEWLRIPLYGLLDLLREDAVRT
jgi:maltose alpha-D-glucosyltransferase / alpha-amylase